MKNILKIVIASLLLSMPHYALTQTLEQIEQLMSLQDLASNETIQQDQNIEDSDQTEHFQPIQINTNNETPNNEGKDFGFSGRNDFLVAPKAKETFHTLKYFGYDYF